MSEDNTKGLGEKVVGEVLTAQREAQQSKSAHKDAKKQFKAAAKAKADAEVAQAERMHEVEAKRRATLQQEQSAREAAARLQAENKLAWQAAIAAKLEHGIAQQAVAATQARTAALEAARGDLESKQEERAAELQRLATAEEILAATQEHAAKALTAATEATTALIQARERLAVLEAQRSDLARQLEAAAKQVAERYIELVGLEAQLARQLEEEKAAQAEVERWKIELGAAEAEVAGWQAEEIGNAMKIAGIAAEIARLSMLMASTTCLGAIIFGALIAIEVVKLAVAISRAVRLRKLVETAERRRDRAKVELSRAETQLATASAAVQNTQQAIVNKKADVAAAEALRNDLQKQFDDKCQEVADQAAVVQQCEVDVLRTTAELQAAQAAVAAAQTAVDTGKTAAEAAAAVVAAAGAVVQTATADLTRQVAATEAATQRSLLAQAQAAEAVTRTAAVEADVNRRLADVYQHQVKIQAHLGQLDTAEKILQLQVDAAADFEAAAHRRAEEKRKQRDESTGALSVIDSIGQVAKVAAGSYNNASGAFDATKFAQQLGAKVGTAVISALDLPPELSAVLKPVLTAVGSGDIKSIEDLGKVAVTAGLKELGKQISPELGEVLGTLGTGKSLEEVAPVAGRLVAKAAVKAVLPEAEAIVDAVFNAATTKDMAASKMWAEIGKAGLQTAVQQLAPELKGAVDAFLQATGKLDADSSLGKIISKGLESAARAKINEIAPGVEALFDAALSGEAVEKVLQRGGKDALRAAVAAAAPELKQFVQGALDGASIEQLFRTGAEGTLRTAVAKLHPEAIGIVDAVFTGKSPEEALRRGGEAALRALVKQKLPQAGGLVDTLLSGGSINLPAVMAAGLPALAENLGPGCGDIVTKLLNGTMDADAGMRQLAAKALGRVAHELPPGAEAVLKRLLTPGNGDADMGALLMSAAKEGVAAAVTLLPADQQALLKRVLAAANSGDIASIALDAGKAAALAAVNNIAGAGKKEAQAAIHALLGTGDKREVLSHLAHAAVATANLPTNMESALHALLKGDDVDATKFLSAAGPAALQLMVKGLRAHNEAAANTVQAIAASVEAGGDAMDIVRKSGSALVNDLAAGDLGMALRPILQSKTSGDIQVALQSAADAVLKLQLDSAGLPADIVTDTKRLLSAKEVDLLALTQTLQRGILRHASVKGSAQVQALSPAFEMLNVIDGVTKTVDPVAAVNTDVLRRTVGTEIERTITSAASRLPVNAQSAFVAALHNPVPANLAPTLHTAADARMPDAAVAQVNAALAGLGLLRNGELFTAQGHTLARGDLTGIALSLTSPASAAILAPLVRTTATMRELMEAAELMSFPPAALPLLRNALVNGGDVTSTALSAALHAAAMAPDMDLDDSIRKALDAASQCADDAYSARRPALSAPCLESLQALSTHKDAYVQSLRQIAVQVLEGHVEAACTGASDLVAQELQACNPALGAGYIDAIRSGELYLPRIAAAVSIGLRDAACVALDEAVTGIPSVLCVPTSEVLPIGDVEENSEEERLLMAEICARAGIPSSEIQALVNGALGTEPADGALAHVLRAAETASPSIIAAVERISQTTIKRNEPAERRADLVPRLATRVLNGAGAIG